MVNMQLVMFFTRGVFNGMLAYKENLKLSSRNDIMKSLGMCGLGIIIKLKILCL